MLTQPEWLVEMEEMEMEPIEEMKAIEEIENECITVDFNYNLFITNS